MNWIGLTGSIGSGKSTVAKLLTGRGFPVVDADYFAKQALSPGSTAESQVLAAFGKPVQNNTGQLDRRLLAGIVFSDPEKLKMLEAIIHPLVQAMTRSRRTELERAGHSIAFYDVPLLFEKKMEPQFDAIVVVYAGLEICIRRVMARSSLRRDDIESRIRSQMAIEEKIKRAHWVVRNEGTESDLEKAVDSLIQDIGRKFPKSG